MIDHALQPGGDQALYEALLSGARDAQDPATLAFAGVMAMARTRRAPYDAPIHGLGSLELGHLAEAYFPCAAADLVLLPHGRRDAASPRQDEFEDLVGLLDEHATLAGPRSRWLARALATASVGDNHLWQDSGLPDRRTLSRLMEEHFSALYVRNVGNMRWKKFFYRALCERADVLICKSPSCALCVDLHECFPAGSTPPPGHSEREAANGKR